MKTTITLYLALILQCAFTQTSDWFIYGDTPTCLRFEDIFFINDSTGFTICGGKIYKTTNAGKVWDLKYEHTEYCFLRSIEFIDDTTGFAGAISKTIFKTVDGGENWYEITPLFNEDENSICGLSAADENTVYACGVWSSPAYIYKSTDKGVTWEYIDMSDYAHSLVDIKFTDSDHGFATGQYKNVDSGGVILYTADGGINWEVRKLTMRPNEIVWKIQILDSVNIFCSIQQLSGLDSMRMIQSSDYGVTWEIRTVTDVYFDAQMIGFINPLQGWIGGWENYALETIDGGDTWVENTFVRDLNRFFKINDSLAFAAGRRIYVYGDEIDNTTLDLITTESDVFNLHINPNPASKMNISFNIIAETFLDLSVYDAQGHLVETIFHGDIIPGTYIKHTQRKYANGKYQVVFYTNELLESKSVIIIN